MGRLRPAAPCGAPAGRKLSLDLVRLLADLVENGQWIIPIKAYGGGLGLQLERPGECGQGDGHAGKRADIIAVRTDRPRQVPMYDPVSHLVYVMRGEDVRLTMVNGRLLMRDGSVLTMDEDQVIRDARAAADQVRKAVQ